MKRRKSAARPRAQAQTPPPAGLTAAFKMVALSHDTGIAAKMTAERAHPVALRIIELLNGNDNDRAIAEELERSILAIYPGLDDPTTIGAAQDAAFNVGFAVCWLLMMAVNGKDGA